MFVKTRANRALVALMVMIVAMLLSGCGMVGSLFGNNEETPSANSAADTAPRAIVPTWTPTPEGAVAEPTATIAFDAAPAGVVAEPEQSGAPAESAAESTSVFADLTPAAVAIGPVTDTSATTSTQTLTGTTPTTETAAATPTAAPAKAQLTVTQQGINVRTGPGTNYGIGGTANTGEVFDIIAKNSAGDWWQVCCVSGEPVWIFGQLATVANTESVPVAANIPEPVAVAPAPAPAQPAPADPAPAPPAQEQAPEPEAPAPPADDPCAGIGGDGCKFKLKGGPSFAGNGGGELKLTLAFIHSGIDGGQPQGSYFVVLLKDGQNVGVPDSVRSFDPSVGFRDGPNGRYNYEWKIGASDLPGGNIQGNYQIWVLDGNGERDSQTFSFNVPEGQGEVWIQFDQA